eukprot:scaffold5391_cov175-Alexandrium_tamarense.AAC.13
MSSDNNNNNKTLVSAPQFGTLIEERERKQLGENRACQAAFAANLLSEVEAEASAIGLTSPPVIPPCVGSSR